MAGGTAQFIPNTQKKKRGKKCFGVFCFVLVKKKIQTKYQIITAHMVGELNELTSPKFHTDVGEGVVNNRSSLDVAIHSTETEGITSKPVEQKKGIKKKKSTVQQASNSTYHLFL